MNRLFPSAKRVKMGLKSWNFDVGWYREDLCTVLAQNYAICTIIQNFNGKASIRRTHLLHNSGEMFKTFRALRWVCPTCAIRQQRSRRSLVNAAAATTSRSPDVRLPLASYTAPGSSYDDRTLRQIFDSQSFW